MFMMQTWDVKLQKLKFYFTETKSNLQNCFVVFDLEIEEYFSVSFQFSFTFLTGHHIHSIV